jgi:uncharacterized protein
MEPTAASAATPATAPVSSPVADPELEARRQRLAALLGRHQRLLIAFSGGVDSTYLLYAALAALGRDRIVAVTGVSESLASRELEEATALAARLGAVHRTVTTRELQDARYAANPQNRCYFCKSELFDVLHGIAASEGCDAIADGTNLDDTHDVRPGRQAARERGVTSPLLEAGLSKADIRALSRAAGLPTWDKPEMPCLSSRIPFGSPVDAEKLRQIERAEEGLRALGVRGARVRHHGDVARVELPAEWLAQLGDAAFRAGLSEALAAAGFRHHTVDLAGYRKGGFHGSSAPIDWRTLSPNEDPRR